jgi:hypothetical protein
MPTPRTPDQHVPPVGYRSGSQRRDWGAHRDDVRRANKARDRAWKLLIALYWEEWQEIATETYAEAGLTPRFAPGAARQAELAARAQEILIRDQLTQQAELRLVQRRVDEADDGG